MAPLDSIRFPYPPCEGCGCETWDSDGDHVSCRGCGECYEDFQRHERVLTPDDGYVRVQRCGRKRIATGDERIILSISTGRDDQRPEHDPEAGIYRPICVAQHMGSGDSVYTYLKYCGKCLHQFGSLGTGGDWISCPYCAAMIGNYVFSDGVEHWHPAEFGEVPPKVWKAAA